MVFISSVDAILRLSRLSLFRPQAPCAAVRTAAAMPQFRLKLDVVPALTSILAVRAISHMLRLRHT